MVAGNGSRNSTMFHNSGDELKFWACEKLVMQLKCSRNSSFRCDIYFMLVGRLTKICWRVAYASPENSITWGRPNFSTIMLSVEWEPHNLTIGWSSRSKWVTGTCIIPYTYMSGRKMFNCGFGQNNTYVGRIGIFAFLSQPIRKIRTDFVVIVSNISPQTISRIWICNLLCPKPEHHPVQFIPHNLV